MIKAVKAISLSVHVRGFRFWVGHELNPWQVSMHCSSHFLGTKVSLCRFNLLTWAMLLQSLYGFAAEGRWPMRRDRRSWGAGKKFNAPLLVDFCRNWTQAHDFVLWATSSCWDYQLVSSEHIFCFNFHSWRRLGFSSNLPFCKPPHQTCWAGVMIVWSAQHRKGFAAHLSGGYRWLSMALLVGLVVSSSCWAFDQTLISGLHQEVI